MSFNMPIEIEGDIDTGGIDFPTTQTPLRIGSAFELTQIRVDLNSNGDMQERKCAACDEEMDNDEPTQTIDGEVHCTGRDEDDAPHTPEWVPLTWAKNIAVSFNEERDEIELSIATGEPRGGWTFKLWRRPDGSVVMSLPHEGMDGPHEPIKQVHHGFFEIG